MFEIEKTFVIAASHQLNLPYESPCNRCHGHSIRIKVFLRADDEYVDKNCNMVMDFKKIKEQIHDMLDHQHLNDIEGIGYIKVLDEKVSLRPTAENLARWICDELECCYKVEVEESSGNLARYIDDSIPRRMGR